MSTALFIYAHPDDESFGAAGTICLLRGHGGRVGLGVATRGDRGQSGELELAGPAALAAVREGEAGSRADPRDRALAPGPAYR